MSIRNLGSYTGTKKESNPVRNFIVRDHDVIHREQQYRVEHFTFPVLPLHHPPSRSLLEMLTCRSMSKDLHVLLQRLFDANITKLSQFSHPGSMISITGPHKSSLIGRGGYSSSAPAIIISYLRQCIAHHPVSVSSIKATGCRHLSKMHLGLPAFVVCTFLILGAH